MTFVRTAEKSTKILKQRNKQQREILQNKSMKNRSAKETFKSNSHTEVERYSLYGVEINSNITHNEDLQNQNIFQQI